MRLDLSTIGDRLSVVSAPRGKVALKQQSGHHPKAQTARQNTSSKLIVLLAAVLRK